MACDHWYFLGRDDFKCCDQCDEWLSSRGAKKLFGIAQHVVVRYYLPVDKDDDLDFLQNQPHIQSVSPFLITAGVIKNQSQAVPAMLLGVDPSSVHYDQLLFDPQVIKQLKPGSFQMIPGYELSRSLYLNSGDRPFLLTASHSSSLLMDVNLKRLNYAQAVNFKVGKNLEEKLAFMHIDDLRAILNLDQKISGFNLQLDDLYEAPAVKRRYRHIFCKSPGDRLDRAVC